MIRTILRERLRNLWSNDLAMLRKILALLFLSSVLTPAFSQNSARLKSGIVNKENPAIYIKVECQYKDSVRLRLYNNTLWAITIPTFSLYVNPKKVITIKLGNGDTAIALPNDRDISSIYYFVEKDGSQDNIDVPRLNYSDSFNPSWIPSNDSIFFTVSKERLREGLRLYVPFNYEWEVNKQGVIHNEAEHKVFFRGIDLLNSDRLAVCQ